MKWLIAYDITCPKRLQKIYRCLCNHALPLQDSVFLLKGSEADYQACHQDLIPQIHPKEDNLRIYALPEHTPIVHFGKRPLPEGIVWSGIALQIMPMPTIADISQEQK